MSVGSYSFGTPLNPLDQTSPPQQDPFYNSLREDLKVLKSDLREWQGKKSHYSKEVDRYSSQMSCPDQCVYYLPRLVVSFAPNPDSILSYDTARQDLKTASEKVKEVSQSLIDKREEARKMVLEHEEGKRIDWGQHDQTTATISDCKVIYDLGAELSERLQNLHEILSGYNRGIEIEKNRRTQLRISQQGLKRKHEEKNKTAFQVTAGQVRAYNDTLRRTARGQLVTYTVTCFALPIIFQDSSTNSFFIGGEPLDTWYLQANWYTEADIRALLERISQVQTSLNRNQKRLSESREHMIKSIIAREFPNLNSD